MMLATLDPQHSCHNAFLFAYLSDMARWYMAQGERRGETSVLRPPDTPVAFGGRSAAASCSERGTVAGPSVSDTTRGESEKKTR